MRSQIHCRAWKLISEQNGTGGGGVVKKENVKCIIDATYHTQLNKKYTTIPYQGN